MSGMDSILKENTTDSLTCLYVEDNTQWIYTHLPTIPHAPPPLLYIPLSKMMPEANTVTNFIMTIPAMDYYDWHTLWIIQGTLQQTVGQKYFCESLFSESLYLFSLEVS